MITTEISNSPQVLFEDDQEQLNCPICLERTHNCDSLSKCPDYCQFRENRRFGADNNLTITILCGHMFHWVCLKDCSDMTCPLCRYHLCP